jgi:hypothetical protein
MEPRPDRRIGSGGRMGVDGAPVLGVRPVLMAVEIAQQWVHDADYASAPPRAAQTAAAFVGGVRSPVASAAPRRAANG